MSYYYCEYKLTIQTKNRYDIIDIIYYFFTRTSWVIVHSVSNPNLTFIPFNQILLHFGKVSRNLSVSNNTVEHIEEIKKMTTIKCSICKQEYKMSDFRENHLSAQHGITGPIAGYLAFLEERIKALEHSIRE